MMNNKIAIDFDGTIHKYSKGWFDGTCYDEPTEDCFETLQQLYDAGYELIIYTCRANSPDCAHEMINWIEDWKEKTGTVFHYIVTSQKPVARCYIDDRGIRFTNWKDMLAYF